MATSATETDSSRKAQLTTAPMPPLINRILVFFYLITWANLGYSTYMAVQNTRDGDYGYLLPIGLTVVLFAVHFALNRRQYHKMGGTLSDQLWGYDEPAWRLYAFMLLWFALTFWLNSISLNFLWVYTPLVASTCGMFPRRIALPLVALQIGAITYHLGLIGFLQSPKLSTN